MFEKKYTTGDKVIVQGDVGDNFYVVDNGEFDVILKQAGDKPVHTYQPGGNFGELALMYNCPRVPLRFDPPLPWPLTAAVPLRPLTTAAALSPDPAPTQRHVRIERRHWCTSWFLLATTHFLPCTSYSLPPTRYLLPRYLLPRTSYSATCADRETPFVCRRRVRRLQDAGQLLGARPGHVPRHPDGSQQDRPRLDRLVPEECLHPLATHRRAARVRSRPRVSPVYTPCTRCRPPPGERLGLALALGMGLGLGIRARARGRIRDAGQG